MSREKFADSKKTIGSRLKLLRQDKGLTLAVMANLLGISAGYLSEVEHDKKSLSQEIMISLNENFNVNLHWFLTGEGQMEEGVSTPITNLRSDTDLAEIIELLKEHPQDKKQVLKLLRGKKDIKEALENLMAKGLNEEPEPA